ncbi:CHASE domain-containing protein [Mesorhizobium sp. J428]|uniref:CHASE domain-containing protein n=1 Tax=Mesorhizobium sp. J428 TaxID=2898440 RepID=UPI0027E22F79|nr:CHASE domain-containing protein [Mesorhizobium sp. J428]
MKRIFPAVVFVSVATASLAMAGYAYVAATDAAHIKFEGTADDAVSRIETRLELHLSLLRATLALYKTGNGSVSRDALRSFVSALDIKDRYAGIRGLGYVRLLRGGAERAAEDDLARNYGREMQVWPLEGGGQRAIVTLLEPLDEGNRKVLGFDMMSEPKRRAAMTRAMETGEARVTGPVSLIQDEGSSKQAGFLVYLPLVLGVPDTASVGQRAAATAGFVYAPFRAGELFSVALAKTPLLPLAIEVYEGEPKTETLIYRSQTPPDRSMGTFRTSRQIEFAGRKWLLRFEPTSAFVWPSSRTAAIALGLFGLALATALAYVVRSGEKAFDAVRALNEAGEKALQEKDLLLQEMKHRIKNSLARVLAIARQTASGAKTVDEFSASFSARLQAMSASQDMLTRSRWQKADLRELLLTEVEQVLGNGMDADRLTGPQVEIDEATTQALGLTFHELATNALKYGAAGTGKGTVAVTWSLTRDGLRLFWRERGGGKVEPPERKGFGTRLIDANIGVSSAARSNEAIPTTGSTSRSSSRSSAEAPVHGEGAALPRPLRFCVADQ